ncbi:hypothetical protein RUND412_001001 [Rhizina undulata]
MRLHHLLRCLLAVPLVLAAEDQGTHSTHFDTKYTLPTNLLITPRTHPHLFSFTGRWQFTPTGHPRTPSYHATLWPGNSVTILIYGSEAAIKLLPQPQGFLSEYRLHVSIDGGEEERYELKDVDSDNPAGYYFGLKLPPPPHSEHDRKLRPHTVKIISSPDTPFSFEGVTIENTHIFQGRRWIQGQDSRPIIEFLGEGIDATRPGGFLLNAPSEKTIKPDPRDAIQSTQQYRLAETMGVRHYHISAGTCLLSSCPDIPEGGKGLGEQYFRTGAWNLTTSAFVPDDDWDPRHTTNLNAQWRFVATSTKPPVQTPEADIVVVDLGILDIDVHSQSATLYAAALKEFLGKVVAYAHPHSKILVLARQTSPELFEATKSTVSTFNPGFPFITSASPASNIHFLPLKTSTNQEYLRALCPYVLAVGVGKNATYCNTVCGGMQELLVREKAHDLFWTGIVVLLVMGGLWVGRVTVIGALAAVAGRKALGLEEEVLEQEERWGVKVV